MQKKGHTARVGEADGRLVLGHVVLEEGVGGGHDEDEHLHLVVQRRHVDKVGRGLGKLLGMGEEGLSDPPPPVPSP